MLSMHLTLHGRKKRLETHHGNAKQSKTQDDAAHR